jgi:hypothetical protein
METTAITRQYLVHVPYVNTVVFLLKETSLSVIASLHNMVGVPGYIHPGSAWHCISLCGLDGGRVKV